MSDANGSSDKKTSFPKNKIQILLLENIHTVAVDAFQNEQFQIETLKGSLSEDELCEKIKRVHAVGIRSKTRLTEKVLDCAERLLCIGCFCIGTDQVDLDAAEKRGIPVFNSPFCNSRSVAELMVAEIISLSRTLTDKSMEMHQGIWNKSANNCHEIRGKTLGIVGYGHIGSQLSVLAESLGLRVIFYDIAKIMPLGNSKPCATLEDLLKKSDYVSLHVPRTDQTNNMIGESQIKLMKKGAYLLNASRGNVVDLDALEAALKGGHIAGAAIDVFPIEPESNINNWSHPLQKLKNVILTPHIGGSTEEAQYAIGAEVAERMISFINSGSTSGAVNFPNIELPYGGPTTHRILNIHKNVPGVLKSINSLLAEVNVQGQFLATRHSVGYIIIDVEQEASGEVMTAISSLPSSLKTRILY